MSRRQLQLIEDYLGRRARLSSGDRVLLVGVLTSGRLSWEEEELMAELAALVRTAGGEVVGKTVQRRRRPDPATFVGKGKVEEVAKLARELAAETLVFSDELSPHQARNLEEATGLKVVDRSQLILDIFALRAGTREAELAVELAQLEYLLPRLRGWGKALTNPGGGIGTRGPGETRLEEDRRKVKRRIQAIRRRLADTDRIRSIRRKRRLGSGIPQIAIVGYTNSGKSTLFRALTGEDTLVEDKLFATLDAKTRRVDLPHGRWALVSDTVGFIRKLPHQLIPAFQATLETVREADLLLIVIDASSPWAREHLATVKRVMVNEVFEDEPLPPVIYVLNKVDRISTSEGEGLLASLLLELSPAVAISALRGQNLDRLQELVSESLASYFSRVEVLLPAGDSRLLSWLADLGRLHRVSWEDGERRVDITLPRARLGSLLKADLKVSQGQ